MNLHVQESCIDRTREIRTGDSPVYESFTDNEGELFRSCQREHGRCISSVYIDGKEGKPRRIGWVFEKRAKYTDTGKTFILETWVTLHEAPPETRVTHRYHELSGT